MQRISVLTFAHDADSVPPVALIRYLPALQAVQAVAPLAEYHPLAHCIHTSILSHYTQSFTRARNIEALLCSSASTQNGRCYQPSAMKHAWIPQSMHLCKLYMMSDTKENSLDNSTPYSSSTTTSA
jgi:hypothetical protein